MGIIFVIVCIVVIVYSIRKMKKDKEAKKKATADRIANENMMRENAENEFKNLVSSVDVYKVSISKDTELERNHLKDMPEIKFKNVAKSFDKNTVPAYVVVDLETTGLKASSDRVVQISAVLYEDFEAVSSFSTYINPGIHIPAEASSINHIYDEDVVNAPSIAEVADSFITFIGSCPIVGYNLGFDLKFLFCSGIDLISSKHKFYDVCALSRKAYKKELFNFSLVSVCNYNGILFDAHDSLNDAFATGELFNIVLDELTVM